MTTRTTKPGRRWLDPLISDFGARFPDAAIIVAGVEEPETRAHGANESLHLGEFARVCEAVAFLLARLGLSAARVEE